MHLWRKVRQGNGWQVSGENDKPETSLFSRRGTESEDLRLVRRAILNGWPVSDDIRRKVMEKVESILDNSQDCRDVINASKVAIQADSLNAKREAMELDAVKGPEIHLHAHTGTEAARQVIESEPEYLEYLRKKALESGSSDS